MKKKSNVNKILGIIFIILFGLLCVVGGIIIGNSGIFKSKVNNSEEILNKNAIETKAEDNKIKDDNNNKIEANNSDKVEENNDKKNEEKKDEKVIEKNEVKTETKTVPETNAKTQSTVTKASNNKLIVIDPGHQIKGNSQQEPIGPGASETKAKVTGGATGVSTGQTEYALNLKVALLLQKKLQDKGYTVIMTRTTNEVNISNKERAEIANNANAAAFIRIHANSLNDKSVKGILTMCQTSNNKYNGYLADKSYRLSKLVLDKVVQKTGGINKGVTRTDTMSGINWCTVPTTIIEMGFLSNPEEDKLLSTSDYQEKIVDGIVEGIEEFLK